jgi:hypothetical protein
MMVLLGFRGAGDASTAGFGTDSVLEIHFSFFEKPGRDELGGFSIPESKNSEKICDFQIRSRNLFTKVNA